MEVMDILRILLSCNLLCGVYCVSFSRAPDKIVKVEIGKNYTLRWNYTLGRGEELLLMRLQFSKVSSFETNSYRIAYRTSDILSVDPLFKNRVHVSRFGALTLWNIAVEDEGYYRCHIELTGGKPISSKVHLLVGSRPVIQRFQKHKISLLEGDNFNINCQASGHPVPQLWWQWKWTKADGNVVGINKSLEIKNASLSNSGEYKCYAHNRMGRSTRTLKIRVYKRPKVSSFSHTASLDGTIYECQDILFICEAYGNNPRVKWFHLYHNRRLVQHGSKTGRFRITQVQREDEGQYSCVPENEYGQGYNSSVYLKVVAAPDNCKTTEFPTEEGLHIKTSYSTAGSSKRQTPHSKVGAAADKRSAGCQLLYTYFTTMVIWSLVVATLM